MSEDNTETASQLPQKRALPLNDLVHHEQDENVKVQKVTENTEDVNENDDVATATAKAESEQISVATAVPEVASIEPTQPYDDSDTDTDDNGEINFDSSMAFDYDKQGNPSPEKPVPKHHHTKVKQSNSKTKLNTLAKSESKEELPRSPKDTSKHDEVTKFKTEHSKTETNETPSETPANGEKGELKVGKESLEGTTENKELKVGKESLEGTTENKESKVSEKKSKNKAKSEEPIKVDNIFKEKPSTKSKKQNLKKDLELLKEINADSKPNKYKNAPMWAQKWRPSVKALEKVDTNDIKLDQSILNFIPDDDLTKAVQDWVYATIYSIDPELRQFIEFEMKFGVIVCGNSPDRVNPPVSTQAVYTEMDGHLTPNVDKILFNELTKYLQGLTKLTENTDKFGTIESHTKDSVYRVGVSTQRPRFLRMSTDVKTGRVGQFIEKRHVSQLMLYSPKDNYDVKLSINLELPVPENEPPEKYINEETINERTKERISFIHNDSCTRFDITRVSNHRQGIKGNDTEVTHEIELEINTPALLMAFDNIATNSNDYASIIRTFLSNGSIVRRKLTSLSQSIYEGSKKVM
ncbi:hypothetical protein TPHA_0H01840 [Tetrapisispora phaffii CBS 4417]|uniref:mRNA-capping enzyme subunit beta n=1 Tax=Tetrapisispora phaffii (strain ATCC 24235 / CBS 4417 / NBRC 1672 / NRRL Y-8282 / UCD 70-5) TaxID=1071381 RepID=G8BX85_TETPH|nr:hypothetical protein TPHA_0H01840 [Tetrapisispora phaffii CBS 4417]CCE64389.1 hypothetical protein TPHA_0H01840 [Tetrapisispora phaffii CBS 4417]